MKSLHKTFDILEFVFLKDGESVTPSEVAHAAGLNLATCARIMGELVARGYLRKVSRKDGYQAGPMIAALFLRRNPYEQLARVAEEPVRRLAERVGMPVNLSVSTGMDTRVMLCCHCGAPAWKQWQSLRFSGGLSTPTERLLLSAQNETLLLKYAAGLTYPLKNWREIESSAMLVTALRAMRNAGTTSFTDSDGVTVMGALLEAPGYPAAAIGFGIHNFLDRAKIQHELLEESSEIVKKLRKTYKAY